MTIREFAKRLQEGKLQEAKVKYHNPKSYFNTNLDTEKAAAEAQDIGLGSSKGVMLYSPQLEGLVGSGIFNNAWEAAEELNKDPDFTNQGNRKEVERNTRSVAYNIFYAALGTENKEDKGKNGVQRNSAYAYKNENGEKVDLYWDFIDDNDLTEYNQKRYNNFLKRDLTPEKKTELITTLKANIPVNKTLTPEAEQALKDTQNSAFIDAFKAALSDWGRYLEDNKKTDIQAIDVYAISGLGKTIYCLSSKDKVNYSRNKADIDNTEAAFQAWLSQQIVEIDKRNQLHQDWLDNDKDHGNQAHINFRKKALLVGQSKVHWYSLAKNYINAVQKLRDLGVIRALDKKMIKLFECKSSN